MKGISPLEYEECYADDVDMILLIDAIVAEEQERKRKTEELRMRSKNARRHH